MVVVSTEAGEPTVKAQAEARRTEFMAGVQSDPRVQDVLARFPGAQIVAVREPDRSLAARHRRRPSMTTSRRRTCRPTTTNWHSARIAGRTMWTMISKNRRSGAGRSGQPGAICDA